MHRCTERGIRLPLAERGYRLFAMPSDRPLAARLAEALGSAYTIEGEIGRGGMGVVYRARDERLQRRVAIKVLPPEFAFQQDIRERFTREAQTAARLSHPHIVPIHSVGEGEGLVYFVMGYVDGESVSARIRRRGQLPVEEARRIMMETADALSAAHALSVIHRDIKPDNILLEGTRGRVMVTDFGIAKALSSTSGATLTGYRSGDRHPGVHEPGTGRRRARHRWAVRPVQPRRSHLSDVDWGAALQRSVGRRDSDEADHGARAGPQGQAARHTGRSGRGSQPMPGKGSGESLGQRGCAAPGAREPVHSSHSEASGLRGSGVAQPKDSAGQQGSGAVVPDVLRPLQGRLGNALPRS